MEDQKELRSTHILTMHKQELLVKYSALQNYINAIVTFRFTVLGFYLATVGLLLGGTPSLEKYTLLAFITIPLYIIELRNRFLKDKLGGQAARIEKYWMNEKEKPSGYELDKTYAFNIRLFSSNNDHEDPGITHTRALDCIYGVIFLYSLARMVILLIPTIMWLFFAFSRMHR